MPDAVILCLLDTIAGRFLAFWCTQPSTRDKVEEVLPISRHVPLLKLTAFGFQIRVRSTQGILNQLILMTENKPGEQVGQSMSVAGDKVDWTILFTQAIKQRIDRCPPFMCRFHKTNMRAT